MSNTEFAPFKWSPSLATGIREIDLQHQELIDMINELDAAHLAGEAPRALNEVLPRLAAYVLFHFGTEEAMMKDAHNIAEHAAVHIAQHSEFAALIATLRKQPATEVDLANLIAYLKRWLVEHIMKTDRELATLLA